MKKYVVKFERIGRARSVRDFYADGPDSMAMAHGWDDFALEIEKFAGSYLISAQFDVAILQQVNGAPGLRVLLDGGRFGEGTIELAPILYVEAVIPQAGDMAYHVTRSLDPRPVDRVRSNLNGDKEVSLLIGGVKTDWIPASNYTFKRLVGAEPTAPEAPAVHNYSGEVDKCLGCGRSVGLTKTGRYRKHEGVNRRTCNNSGYLSRQARKGAR